MANQQQLNILNSGKEAWHEWRANNPVNRDSLQPAMGGIDLSGADLRERNLNEYNFSRVDFTGANLTGTQLRLAECDRAVFNAANLERADLCGAKLRAVQFKTATLNNAKLAGVNLLQSDLYGAYLQDVDFRRANLSETDFRWADLSGADLSEAIINETDFTNATLYRVKGIDCRTLRRSIGWQTAARDPSLACGEEIPVHSGSRRIIETIASMPENREIQEAISDAGTTLKDLDELLVHVLVNGEINNPDYLRLASESGFDDARVIQQLPLLAAIERDHRMQEKLEKKLQCERKHETIKWAIGLGVIGLIALGGWITALLK